MPKINIKQLERDLRPAINSLANLSFGAALEKFNSAKQSLIFEFDQHPVTKELKSGPDAPNYSETLDGYSNLFAFIGFNAGDDPTAIVEQHLKQFVQLLKRPHIQRSGRFIIFNFDVIVPTMSDFEDITGYPEGWNSGSWLVDVEFGIPNLRYHLYKRGENIEGSRSGPGIQVKNVVRGNESYSRTSYMSELLRKFILRIERFVD